MEEEDGVSKMLEVRNVWKSYQSRTIVRDLNLLLKPCEIVGYIGPNGSGKTTTAGMLAGLIPPSRGAILFDKRDIFDDSVEYKRRLGYVPEQADVYPHLTAVEYLQLVGRLRLLPEAGLRRKIEGFLEVFGLTGHCRRPMACFSKGMRQKVLISAALLHDPKILILDEPLSGLDVGAIMLLRSILSLLAERGKIVLYSSHVLDSVEKLCSRVLILHQGAVVAEGTVDELRGSTEKKTLEDVFSQVVANSNGSNLAQQVLEIMEWKP